MIKLALCATLLAGCASGRVRGVTGLEALSNSETGISMVSCNDSSEGLQLADVAIPVLLSELAADGFTKSYLAELEHWHRGKRPTLCMVDEPQSCCLGGPPCAGPYHPTAGAARKAGCATYAYVWVSRAWPPICRPRWPDEPHCTDYRAPYDWRPTLVVELANMLMQRIGIKGIHPEDAAHSVYQPGGPIARAIARVMQ